MALFESLTGLTCAGQDADSAILRRISELGLAGPAAYRALLSTQGEAGSEMAALASLLTNNETYFFRDRAQLVAAAGWAERLHRASPGRKLAIWSAGCSTGEEPYSLAMLLEESLATGSYAITATDLDDRALAHARLGRYRGRSVRLVDPGQLARYFVRDGACHEVSEPLRGRVRFARHNLASNGPVPSPEDAPGFDLILCRNVLIYFAADAMRQTIARFASLLNPGGALFLGASESLQFLDSPFQAVRLTEAFGYVLRGQPEPQARAGSSQSGATAGGQGLENPSSKIGLAPGELQTPVLPGIPAAKGQPDASPGVPPTPAAAHRAHAARRAPPARRREAPSHSRANRKPTRHPLVEAAAAHASGRLEEAARLCEQALASQPLEPAAYRLLYRVQVDLGLADLASATIRRLLYLEPEDLPARYVLARLLLRSGNPAEARREFLALRVAAAGRNPEELLPDGDGLSFGMLGELCRAALDEAGLFKRTAGDEPGDR